MKKWITLLLLAPVLGAILGYLLVNALNDGWFKSKWQMVEKPPGDAHRLVALSKDSVWVQSDSGTLYYNENSSACKANCWIEVKELPTLPILESPETRVTGEACAPAPPLIRVAARISECRSEMWVDRNFIFALRSDGTLYLWQADIYGEWTVVIMLLGICGGAAFLFLPTLILVLSLSWLGRRAKRLNN
jgi:hypothetical protein